MGEVSVRNSIFGVMVSVITALLALPAVAADTPDAGVRGQAVGTGQPDAGSSSASKKGYDYYRAQSDMSSSRAPAGVTHEYHRACTGEGGDADCDGKADDDGAAKATGGGTQVPNR
jgi:hypothetical protein